MSTIIAKEKYHESETTLDFSGMIQILDREVKLTESRKYLEILVCSTPVHKHNVRKKCKNTNSF